MKRKGIICGYCSKADVIPSPEAVMTHKIFGTDENELCELDAMKKIHNLMNRPGTTSVGYNTLGFDDEFFKVFILQESVDALYPSVCIRMRQNGYLCGCNILFLL